MTFSASEQLIKIFSTCEAAISYAPLKNEVDLETLSIKLPAPAQRIFLPINKNSDPFVWAEKCLDRFGGLEVCVFIPGKKFDRYGTRHGRGNGWYDRFLSKIPKRWTRIGVSSRKNVSLKKLKREAWDEPMDWLIIPDDDISPVIKTGARKRRGKPK